MNSCQQPGQLDQTHLCLRSGMARHLPNRLQLPHLCPHLPAGTQKYQHFCQDTSAAGSTHPGGGQPLQKRSWPQEPALQHPSSLPHPVLQLSTIWEAEATSKWSERGMRNKGQQVHGAPNKGLLQPGSSLAHASADTAHSPFLSAFF